MHFLHSPCHSRPPKSAHRFGISPKKYQKLPPWRQNWQAQTPWWLLRMSQTDSIHHINVKANTRAKCPLNTRHAATSLVAWRPQNMAENVIFRDFEQKSAHSPAFPWYDKLRTVHSASQTSLPKIWHFWTKFFAIRLHIFDHNSRTAGSIQLKFSQN